MELTTRNPYWLLKNGYHSSYPSLQENIQTDIIVMGGGITGALVTYRLINAGLESNGYRQAEYWYGKYCCQHSTFYNMR